VGERADEPPKPIKSDPKDEEIERLRREVERLRRENERLKRSWICALSGEVAGRPVFEKARRHPRGGPLDAVRVVSTLFARQSSLSGPDVNELVTFTGTGVRSRLRASIGYVIRF
jgi:hypothetical protein